MTDPTSPVTLAELGALLDLDKSTVSLALRDSPRIAEETRRRVHAAAERHGYRTNLAARQLNHGARALHMLGLYLPRSLASLSSPVAVRTIQTLSRLSAEHGLLFQVLASVPSGASGFALRPDASLVWGDMPMDEAAEILSRGRRALVIDPNHASYADHRGPAVRLDNAGGAAGIVRAMIARGSQRLLFVQVSASHLGHQERWRGARSAWLAQRPIGSVATCQLDDIDDAMLAGFAAGGDGAIICSSDTGSLHVWRRLQRLGLAGPQHVRIAGFDGEEFARVLGLATAVFDYEGLAQAAFAAVTSSEPPADIPPIPFRLALGASI